MCPLFRWRIKGATALVNANTPEVIYVHNTLVHLQLGVQGELALRNPRVVYEEVNVPEMLDNPLYCVWNRGKVHHIERQDKAFGTGRASRLHALQLRCVAARQDQMGTFPCKSIRQELPNAGRSPRDPDYLIFELHNKHSFECIKVRNHEDSAPSFFYLWVWVFKMG